MSDHTRPRQIVRLAVLALVLAGLVGVTSAAGAAGDDRPHRWSGYAIAGTGHAAGGWIGGYRVGHHELYLTTPTRTPNRAGFRRPHLVGDLKGKVASRRETARAAWILSKYGAYREATQSAAVDASVYHLLVGGAWHIDKRLGARRIRQSGNGDAVARFARIMLRQSRQSAGAYTARLDVAGTDVGGTVAVTLSVLDGHGRPAPGLPVTLRMAGADPREAVTGDDGQAVARFSADARGWQGVTATVAHVPEHRLRLRSPDRKGQASSAEGGVTRTLVVSTAAAVRGAQTLSLAASPSQLVAGAPARVVATVSGDGAARTATGGLYGPFPTAAAAGCTGSPVATVSTPVAADGAYALPSVTPSGGYYAWRVAVDGTDTNLPISACGATTQVRARPVTSVDWAPVTPSANSNVTATASVAGLPFPAQVTLRITLYQDASCGSAIDSKDLARFGNGSVSASFLVFGAGAYSWKAETLFGDLWAGTSSPCRGMSVS
ncbi:hypothetical protein J2X46_002258 [Nocardioides sp. BE266]|uniref:hypothetical protein n=1 Tax=Nocardioides sp. BE266 TaxID=2817725 RepID=UPI00285B56A6|nr:hypothetical protein [Nocardioides sp. BE266]MDR7253273.1 hypothetical protein [Nocardioides sp. BE266]